MFILTLSCLLLLQTLVIVNHTEAQNYDETHLINGQVAVSYTYGTGLPVILTAPHGGNFKPDEIPDRDAGCVDQDGNCIWSHTCEQKDNVTCGAKTVRDQYTLEIAQAVRDRLCELSANGECPALIINHLHRSKLDAARAKDEATFGNAIAVAAYDFFFEKLVHAKNSISPNKGIIFDIHGHGHTIQRDELGYQIHAGRLREDDYVPRWTSIRRLYQDLPTSTRNFTALIKGPESFGGFLEAQGYECVPSPGTGAPASNEPYFLGGYITKEYGSKKSGKIDAIQIEGARDHRENTIVYAHGLAQAMMDMVDTYY